MLNYELYFDVIELTDIFLKGGCLEKFLNIKRQPNRNIPVREYPLEKFLNSHITAKFLAKIKAIITLSKIQFKFS